MDFNCHGKYLSFTLLEIKQLNKIPELVRDLKSYSSKWIHNHFPTLQYFSWQPGYGSFTVSYSSIEAIVNYIKNQEVHHKKMTFEEEYLKFLQKHNIQYNGRYVFG